jgi:hypothetical protein
VETPRDRIRNDGRKQVFAVESLVGQVTHQPVKKIDSDKRSIRSGAKLTNTFLCILFILLHSANIVLYSFKPFPKLQFHLTATAAGSRSVTLNPPRQLRKFKIRPPPENVTANPFLPIQPLPPFNEAIVRLPLPRPARSDRTTGDEGHHVTPARASLGHVARS